MDWNRPNSNCRKSGLVMYAEISREASVENTNTTLLIYSFHRTGIIMTRTNRKLLRDLCPGSFNNKFSFSDLIHCVMKSFPFYHNDIPVSGIRMVCEDYPAVSLGYLKQRSRVPRIARPSSTPLMRYVRLFDIWRKCLNRIRPGEDSNRRVRYRVECLTWVR